MKTIDYERWTDIEVLEAFSSFLPRVTISPEIVGDDMFIHLVCGDYKMTSAPVPIYDPLIAETKH